jgi:hypothetical protein
VKRPSKQVEVIAMLRRPEGATVDEVASAMGWQRYDNSRDHSGAQPARYRRESIANALGALVQAGKVSSQREGDKYFPAAAEVPTAPDQPSS